MPPLSTSTPLAAYKLAQQLGSRSRFVKVIPSTDYAPAKKPMSKRDRRRWKASINKLVKRHGVKKVAALAKEVLANEH